MIRALLRLVIVLVVLVAAGAFLLGYWGSHRLRPAESAVVGTSGQIDTTRAREAGAKVGEKTAEAANKVGEKTAEAATKAGELIADGALTAKIKSKMALDDMVKARAIDVTTTGHVVTLNGTVTSSAEHDRAVLLAKETAGVTKVVDNLKVR